MLKMLFIGGISAAFWQKAPTCGQKSVLQKALLEDLAVFERYLLSFLHKPDKLLEKLQKNALQNSFFIL